MYDVVVIGAGPGGYVAAIRAAQLGMKTALIEKEKTLGGTCLNVGCIPSKALLQSSEHYNMIENHGKEHGIATKGLSVNFKQMMKRKEGVVESLTAGVAGLVKRNKIERIEGTATFINPNQIQVNGETIDSKSFIIATGSEPIPLPFAPFDEKVIVSSTGVLSLPKIPKKMIVVGAGVIGVELASVYNRLGTKVTIVEMLDYITPGVDGAICKMFLQILRKQGLEFHLGAKVTGIDVKKGKASVGVDLGGEEKKLDADVVLVAIGRRPYTEELGLDAIGIETNRGMIQVDANFRTKHPNILAIGDVIDGPMLAHKASEEGIAAAEVLAGLHSHVNYIAIPSVIYTHPEVAGTGLTEEEAKAHGFQVMIGKFAFKGNARARCAGDTDGMVKVVGDKESGRLLGVHIIGPNASEMIGEGVIALEKRATVEELAVASHAHPTLCESIKEAALNALGRAIHM